MIVRQISVFDYGDLPRDLQEHVCDEQSNDSFRKVFLDAEKEDGQEYKVAQWAIENGAQYDESDTYAYVLFSISW